MNPATSEHRSSVVGDQLFQLLAVETLGDDGVLADGGQRRVEGESWIDHHPYLRDGDSVKTTVEIPDSLFREIKTAAARRGLSLKTFLTEALKEKLSRPRRSRQEDWPVPPPKLAEGEMRRVQSAIDAEFSRIDAEEWK